MAISLYMGKIEGDTVANFYPITFATISQSNLNMGGIPSEFPISTSMDCQYSDLSNAVDLRTAIFAITGFDPSNPDYSVFNDVEISFFTSNSIDSKLNMTLRMIRSYNEVAFFLGDRKIGAMMKWRMDPATKAIYILQNPAYAGSTLSELLESVRAFEGAAFASGVYTTWLNYAQYIPFTPMTKSDDSSTCVFPAEMWMVGNNKFAPNLSRFGNWYTMVTGEYYYGNPVTMELAIPVNGISEIVLTQPISLAEVDVGNIVTQTHDEVDADAVFYNYFNVGTDLTCLFSNNSTGSQTVLLKNGGYITQDISLGDISYSILFNEKGLKGDFKYGPYTFADRYGTDFEGIGAYLVVDPAYVESDPVTWIGNVSENYSEYAHGAQPFAFATYCWRDGSPGYFDFEEYPYADVPCLVSNCLYINYYYEKSAYMDPEQSVDYDFWVGILEGVGVVEFKPGEGSVGGGYSKTGGGDGTFDDTGDDIAPASVPLTSVNSGFLKVHCEISNTELNFLSNWLNDSTIFSDRTKYLDGITAVYDLWLPHAPSGSEITSNQPFTLLGQNVDFSGPVFANRYIEYSLGSITVKEYFGTYLDYDPHTKIQIFLPFCGVHDLNTDDIINNKITLSCIIDVLSGDIVYRIKVDDESVSSVLYTFSGNCSAPRPISSVDYSGKISLMSSAIVTSAASAVAAGVKGGAMAGPTGALIGAGVAGGIGMAGSLMAGKSKATPDVKRNTANGGSCGALSVRYPYLIITRPKWSLPENYAHQVGFPSDVATRLSSCTGFTKVRSVHLEGLTDATEDEIKQIESALKEGVII